MGRVAGVTGNSRELNRADSLKYHTELERIARDIDMTIHNAMNSDDFLADMLTVNFADTADCVASMLTESMGNPTCGETIGNWTIYHSESIAFCARYFLRVWGATERFLDGASLQLFIDRVTWSNLSIDKMVDLYRYVLTQSGETKNLDGESLIDELQTGFMLYLSWGIDDGTVSDFFTETFQNIGVKQ